MKRAIRKLAVILCLILLAGGTYWHWDSVQQQNRTGLVDPQKAFKAQARRGGAANPNDTVPIAAAAAWLADAPVYFDGVGTAKALNTVTVHPAPQDTQPYFSGRPRKAD
jgi:membrane fusion protein, multidrug efflux system